ncbi:MAG: nucleotidyltransferase family protein [Bacilli bacterium]|jgi:hypothetical protein
MIDKNIEIVKAVLNKSQEKFALTEMDFRYLTYQSLAPFGYLVMDKKGTPEDIQKKFHDAYFLYYYKDMAQNSLLESLKKSFEENKIPLLLLKGSILKDYYPQTNLRYRGDIDVLVKEEDYSKSEKIIESLGFKKGLNSEVHESFSKGSLLEIELHHRLFSSQMDFQLSVTDEPFEHAITLPNYQYIYSFNRNDFLLYMILHLTKHLIKSGTGLRSFLDIYLYLQKEKNLDLDYVQKEFDSLYSGYDFDFLMSFTNDLFTKDTLTAEEDALYKEIIHSGTYGSMNVRNEKLVKKNHNNKFKAIMRSIFPTRLALQENYPSLAKHHWLYPVFWFVKVFKMVFIHPFRSIKKAKAIMKVKNTKEDEDN